MYSAFFYLHQNRSNLIAEQRQTQDLIVGLLQHIGQGLEDSSNLPQANAMGVLLMISCAAVSYCCR